MNLYFIFKTIPRHCIQSLEKLLKSVLKCRKKMVHRLQGGQNQTNSVVIRIYMASIRNGEGERL